MIGSPEVVPMETPMRQRSRVATSMPESSSAIRAAATASCEPRPSVSGSRSRTYPAGSKSFTSAPICTGKAEVSNDSTGPMPLAPAVRFRQNSSRPAPMGVTRPRPVMTTRLIKSVVGCWLSVVGRLTTNYQQLTTVLRRCSCRIGVPQYHGHRVVHVLNRGELVFRYVDLVLLVHCNHHFHGHERIHAQFLREQGRIGYFLRFPLRHLS